jgi:hypothetical protein
VSRDLDGEWAEDRERKQRAEGTKGGDMSRGKGIGREEKGRGWKEEEKGGGETMRQNIPTGI